jgi:hypothetical protein
VLIKGFIKIRADSVEGNDGIFSLSDSVEENDGFSENKSSIYLYEK